jgi:hypothetical protein
MDFLAHLFVNESAGITQWALLSIAFPRKLLVLSDLLSVSVNRNGNLDCFEMSNLRPTPVTCMSLLILSGCQRLQEVRFILQSSNWGTCYYSSVLILNNSNWH